MKNKYGRYTSMAIYIDEHIYQEDKDEDRIYKYIYKLFYMFAKKKKFFIYHDDYINYSYYAANVMYMRLINKKQFLPDDDPKKLPKVKSVLNFIKTIAYPMKVNYQRETFGMVYNDEYSDEPLTSCIREDLKRDVKQSNEAFINTEKISYLKSVPKIIKTFLNNTPYTKNKVLMNNLYMTCLLTLLNDLTLSNKNLERLEIKSTKQNIDKLLTVIYKEEIAYGPILYHVPKELKNYVFVLMNRIRKLILKDLQQITNYYEPSDELLENILMQPLSDLGGEE